MSSSFFILGLPSLPHLILDGTFFLSFNILWKLFIIPNESFQSVLEAGTCSCALWMAWRLVIGRRGVKQLSNTRWIAPSAKLSHFTLPGLAGWLGLGLGAGGRSCPTVVARGRTSRTNESSRYRSGHVMMTPPCSSSHQPNCIGLRQQLSAKDEELPGLALNNNANGYRHDKFDDGGRMQQTEEGDYWEENLSSEAAAGFAKSDYG